MFNLKTESWIKGHIPDIKYARTGHSSCSVKGTAYVYGGFSSQFDSCLNTIEYMPFKTYGKPENSKWAIISIKNFAPRLFSLMMPINDNILIAGGSNMKDEYFSDAKILDMNQKKSVSAFDTGI